MATASGIGPRYRLVQQRGDACDQVGQLHVVARQQITLPHPPLFQSQEQPTPGLGRIDDVARARNVAVHAAAGYRGDQPSGARPGIEFTQGHAGNPDHHRQASPRLLAGLLIQRPLA